MVIVPRHDDIPQPTTATMSRDNSSHVAQEFLLDTTAQHSMPIAPRHDGIPQLATPTMLRDNSIHVTQEFVLDTTAQPPLKPLLLKFDLLDQPKPAT
jgi:hypothetical protein